MLQTFVFLTALVASAAANKTEDCSSFTALDLVPARTDYDQLVQSELQFTADLYRKIGMRRSSDNINVMFTPFNIYNSLLIMYFMSANRTEHIIEELFHIPKNQTKINIHGIYNTLTYHKRHSVDVKLASRQTESYRKKKAKRQFVKDDYCLFLSNQYKVKSCAWKFFNKNIKVVDFTKPEETVKTMNEWVSNQTGNTDVSLEPNNFDNYTHILFANTALFHGIWKQPFTSIEPNQEFRMMDGTTKNITLMVQTGMFNYWFDKDLNVDILEMPYNGNVYNVIILLPRNESRTVIAQLLTSLSRQKLNDIIVKKSNVKKTNVKIEIPKFKVEKTYDLVKTMNYMGFSKIFDSPIDLSNILEQSNHKKITKFRVKATYSVKVEFDELKTQSQAVMLASAKKNYYQSRVHPRPPVFRADHPFVYFIYSSTKLIVFAGVLYIP